MQIVSTPAAPAATGPYAQGVVADGLLYTSGQIPLDADGRFVAGDIEVQAAQVLGGYSLVVRTPAVTAARDWDKKSTWRTSTTAQGNPGVADQGGTSITLGHSATVTTTGGGYPDGSEVYYR